MGPRAIFVARVHCVPAPPRYAPPRVDRMLWAASRAGLLDTVTACLEADAQPANDMSGAHSYDCALLDAGRLGRRAVVKRIVRLCADDKPPLPPDWVLFAAAGAGILEVAIDAIDDGANADIRFYEESPGQIAKDNGHETMVKLLRNVQRRGSGSQSD